MDTKNKRVLLFSAGMDSFIYKKLYNFSNSECLFVDMGTVENMVEKLYMDKFFPTVERTTLPLVKYELDNKVIPYRNYFLTMIAANYGNEIHFGFTVGDKSEDKNYVFAEQMESILTYFASGPHRVHVMGPFFVKMLLKPLSKTQILKKYIDEGYSVDELLTKTHSCYHPIAMDVACGKCHSCVRNYVALTLNGIAIHKYFYENPLNYLEDFLEESIKKNREQEVVDMKECLKLMKK